MKKSILTRTVRIAILCSGGKDSSYAHWWANLQGWDVLALITCKIIKNDSMMFQIPCVDIVEFQSKVTNTKYIEFKITGDEKTEMIELEKQIFRRMEKGQILHQIDGLVSGALKSDYQKSRVEIMCQNLNIKSFSPLWHKDSGAHMKSLLSHGFEVMISSVSCEGLGKEWLGTVLNKKSFSELLELSRKYRFSVDGEGGEYETSVLNAPHFKSRILVKYDTEWHNSRGIVKFNSIFLGE